MHAGFQALRQHCPTNFRRPVRKIALTEAVEADVARIEAAWAHARKGFGKSGPFLFGRFSAADAMFAPVVNRFHVYDVPVGRASARLYEGGDGAAGLEGLDRRRRGGRMAHRKIRSALTRARELLTPGSGRPRERVRSLAGRRIIAEGLEHSFWKDFYLNAMTASWPTFFGALAAGFVVLNLAFACLYSLGEDPIANAPKGDFSDLFFFSVETSSTVGYGDMHPQTFYGHVVATFESFVAIVLIAVMTGLMFARFSRPRARLMFAQHPVDRRPRRSADADLSPRQRAQHFHLRGDGEAVDARREDVQGRPAFRRLPAAAPAQEREPGVRAELDAVSSDRARQSALWHRHGRSCRRARSTSC